MQRARRANPYPFAWEVPLGATVGAVLLLILAVHLARTVANLIAGGGSAFTPRAELFTSLPGLLRGDAAAGLPALTQPASAAALWTWTILIEILVVMAIGCATKAGLDRWGPGRVHGMASRAEAERLLGRPRRVAPLVRPDLYGKPRSRR